MFHLAFLACRIHILLTSIVEGIELDRSTGSRTVLQKEWKTRVLLCIAYRMLSEHAFASHSDSGWLTRGGWEVSARWLIVLVCELRHEVAWIRYLQNKLC